MGRISYLVFIMREQSMDILATGYRQPLQRPSVSVTDSSTARTYIDTRAGKYLTRVQPYVLLLGDATSLDSETFLLCLAASASLH